MSTKRMVYGKKVRAIRGALLLTQLELSRLAGLHRNTLTVMEIATRNPPEFKDIHDRVAMALCGMSADEVHACDLAKCIAVAIKKKAAA